MIPSLASSTQSIHFIATPIRNGLSSIWLRVQRTFDWLHSAALRLLLSSRQWVLHPRSVTSRIQANAIQRLSRSKQSFEDVLPILPVPELQHSVDKYLQSIKPFVSRDDYASIQTRSRYFVVEEGKELQAKLVELAKQKRNWLEETWLNYAYLENRFSAHCTAWYGLDSVVPTTNKYLFSKVDRAARLIFLVMQFREKIRLGTLPETEGGVPICMHQFKRVFGANRTPGKDCDTLDVYSDSEHIIVLVRGKVYQLRLFDDKGARLSEGLIASGLRKIYANAVKDDSGEHVSVLSMQDRNKWFEHKSIIKQKNEKNLQIMDTALFALRLSDLEPTNDTNEAAGLFQDAENLFIDKGITFTAFANGKFGGTMEHTMADATVVSKMMEWVYANENYPANYRKEDGELSDQYFGRLDWQLSESIKEAISRAQTAVQMNLCVLSLNCSVFESFGKKGIQSLKCSPDSFVQMALQLAYFRIHKKIPFTYESASTRMFYHGRTETIRSASTKSHIFCRVMSNKKMGKEEKYGALKEAIQAHVTYKREAVSGLGCDRHLLALRRLAGAEKYNFFEKPDFNLTYDLATSQTPIKYSKGGGFGPSSMTGFGISYHLEDNRIRFHISKYKVDEKTSALMASAISQALNDMKDLFNETPSQPI